MMLNNNVYRKFPIIGSIFPRRLVVIQRFNKLCRTAPYICMSCHLDFVRSFPKQRLCKCLKNMCTRSLNITDCCDRNVMKLNVGGIRFSIRNCVLNRFPQSRLSRLRNCAHRGSGSNMRQLCDGYDDEDNIYFFDRDPDSFRVLQSCYKGVQIHMPRSMCPLRLTEEMAYWGVDDAQLDSCCEERRNTASNFVEELEQEVENKIKLKEITENKTVYSFEKIRTWKNLVDNISKIRWLMRITFTDPSSSVYAKAWTITSVGFIILSLTTFVISTLDKFQKYTPEGVEIENEVISLIEKVCISWFTLEYSLPFIASDDKLAYIRSALNIIDLITIVPYFVQLYLEESSHSGGKELESLSNVMQVFRIMRVLRVFRLGRHSTGLQVLFKTILRSSSELALLALYLIIGMIFLATIEYSIEDGGNFEHLGDAFWWSAITITTVGYGDITPESIPGKLVASFSFLIGVLAFGLPIHPIIANFTFFYKRNEEVECAFKRTLKKQQNPQLLNKVESEFPSEFSNLENPIAYDTSLITISRDDIAYEETTARGVSRVTPISNRSPVALWKRAMQKINGKSNCESRKFSLQNDISTSCDGKASLHCHCVFCKDEVSFF